MDYNNFTKSELIKIINIIEKHNPYAGDCIKQMAKNFIKENNNELQRIHQKRIDRSN